MDAVLSAMSVEGFKILAVVAALLFGTGVFFGFFRRWYWALFTVVFSYMVATTSVGVYVLMNFSDPRWSAGKEPLLQPPSLGNTPVVGELMRPLEDFLRDAATSINEVVAFRHALPVAQEFFALAGWAFVALIPVTITALVVSRIKSATLAARFERLDATVQAQGAEIEALKRTSSEQKPQDDGEGTGTSSH